MDLNEQVFELTQMLIREIEGKECSIEEFYRQLKHSVSMIEDRISVAPEDGVNLEDL